MRHPAMGVIEQQFLGGKSGAGGRDEVALVVSLAGQTGRDGGAEVTVDDSGGELGNGIIRNVAIMTAGMAYPAVGEPFEIDEVMLRQTAESINAADNNVKCRASHPELESGVFGGMKDSLFYLVGRPRDARLVPAAGEGHPAQVRGDIHIGDYADIGPQGEMGRRLKSMAASDPTVIGISIRYFRGEYVDRSEQDLPPLGRVYQVTAVDFVGTPASNPHGLLSGLPKNATDSCGRAASDGLPAGGGANDNRHRHNDGHHTGTRKEPNVKLSKKQRNLLVALGMKPEATEADIQSYIDQLSADNRELFESLAEKPATKKGAADPPADPAQDLGGNGQPRTPAEPPTVDQATRDRIAAEALAADRKRRDDIIALGKDDKGADRPGVTVEWLTGLADRGASLAEVRNLVELASTMQPLRQPAGSTWVGPDARHVMLRDAVGDAIMLRAGIPLYEFNRSGRAIRNADGSLKTRKPHERSMGYAELSFARLCGQHLAAHGVPGVAEMGDAEIIALAMNRQAMIDRFGASAYLAMSTSDLPNILTNTVRASVRAYYAEAENDAIYPRWCGRVTVPDFRAFPLIAISELPKLLLRPEGDGVRYATFREGAENIQVFQFSRGLRWTKQAQRNDTFGVFAQQLRYVGGLGVELMDRLTTAIVVANAALADTGALFNANAITVAGGHANLANPQVTLSISNAANWAASIAALSAGRTALATRRGMRTEEDGDGGAGVLNLRVAFVLVASAIEDTARTIVGSDTNGVAGVGVLNPVRNMVPPDSGVVGNPFLDVAGQTATCILGANPNGPGGGVKAGFLQGEETPQVRAEMDFDTGDFKVVVEMAGGAKADDFRGLQAVHL